MVLLISPHRPPCPSLPSLPQAERSLPEKREQLLACKAAVRQQLLQTNSCPLMLRLAWSDCATFDKNARLWPQCGGAVGSVRFEVCASTGLMGREAEG